MKHYICFSSNDKLSFYMLYRESAKPFPGRFAFELASEALLKNQRNSVRIWWGAENVTLATFLTEA